MHRARWILLAGLWIASSAWSQEGLGLTPNADTLTWARWQGRISLGTTTPVWRSALASYETPGLKPSSLAMMGDYYFTKSMLGSASVGGFRATGGVVIGPRASLWATASTLASGGGLSVERRLFTDRPPLSGADAAIESVTAPYIGVGYTGLSARGGWSLSADMGVLALAPGNAVRFGRFGGNSLNDAVREMRLSPVLQLGVSYSF